MSRKKKILLGLLVLLVCLQFYPINREVPEVDQNMDFLVSSNVDEAMAQQIKSSCYDCHSYETEYPSYAQIAPLSMWIQGHVKNGRAKLNFSEWGSFSADEQRHELEECVEILEKKWMPLKSYMWLHPDGKLDDASRNELIEFFKKSI